MKHHAHHQAAIMRPSSWCHQQKARYATPECFPIPYAGKNWVRDHPRVCPACRSIFFDWRPEGAAWEPHRMEQEPNTALGEPNRMRATCGDPRCAQVEEEAYYRRDPNYQLALRSYYSAPEANEPSSKPNRRGAGLKKIGT